MGCWKSKTIQFQEHNNAQTQAHNTALQNTALQNTALQNTALQNTALQNTTLDTAQELTYNFTEAKVVSVYDGDTITVVAYFDGGFKRFNVRLYGIDCAEMRGGTDETKKKAIAAKQFVINRVLDRIVKIEVLNNQKLDGHVIREKYGRLLARITTPDNQDLSDLLIQEGLANPYFGGTKL